MIGIGSVTVLVGLTVAALAAAIGTRELRRIKAARFAGRNHLSGREFYHLYYTESGIEPRIVIGVRDEVGRALEIDAELMRPTDRFQAELAPAQGWERFWDEGLYELMRTGPLILGTFRDVEWKEVQTLDDLIRAVAQNVEVKS
jgi:hypothetical protein